MSRAEEINPFQSPGGGHAPAARAGAVTRPDGSILVEAMLQVEDFWEARRLLDPWWQRWLIPMLLPAVFVVVGVAWLGWHGDEQPIPGWATVAVGGYTAFSTHRRLRRQVRMAWERQQGPFEPFRATFSEDAVEWATATMTHLAPWNVYRSSTITKRLVLLRFRGLRNARIVPRSALPDESSWQALLALLERRLPPAQNTGATNTDSSPRHVSPDGSTSQE